MVMAPTPPGTGVMAPARWTAEANSTSPTSLPFAVRLVPTSITVARAAEQAPGSHAAPITFGPPGATFASHDDFPVFGRGVRARRPLA